VSADAGATVVYMAHPIGGDPEGNLARARRWMRWILDHYPMVAVCVPWLPYVEVLDDYDPEHRDRGVRDDLEILKRCDEVWLVGDRVSPGMEAEKWLAISLGKVVVDFTQTGLVP
jgi:hypothetical protein